LSDTLYRLQKTLGAEWLEIDGDTVALCYMPNACISSRGS
jgi:hypothetical protein